MYKDDEGPFKDGKYSANLKWDDVIFIKITILV